MIVDDQFREDDAKIDKSDWKYKHINPRDILEAIAKELSRMVVYSQNKDHRVVIMPDYKNMIIAQRELLIRVNDGTKRQIKIRVDIIGDNPD